MMLPFDSFAAPNPAEIRQQQDILQRQREQQLQEQMQPRSDVHLDVNPVAEQGLVNPISHTGDQSCFHIQEVVLRGEHSRKFQFALKEALHHTEFNPGKCLNANDINQIMVTAQNVLIARGYITTRILAAPQNLNNGRLELTLLAGLVKGFEVNQENNDQTYAQRIVAFQNEFPMRSDRILNLRDLEQGLENLKRVPTVEADIQIVPVEGIPDESMVAIQWQQRLLPYHLSLGIDNSGSRATGKHQGNITFSADNPFGLSDLFYVSYGRAIGNVPKERDDSGNLKKGNTRNYAIHYSVPFGKWIWALNHSSYRYHQAVAGLNQVYDYNGTSNTIDFGFNRLLYRDAQRKTYLGAKLWTREAHSYIDDAEITVQKRKVSGWLVDLSHREYLGHGTVQFKLAYKRGTGMYDALAAPEEEFDEGTSRMKIWTISADLNHPFHIGQHVFFYDTTLHAQWNKSPLTSQDQLAIGGRYTVRGFDGEMSLSGERGWYWRNELGWQVAQRHQLYGGLDTGHISGRASQYLLGQTLMGATVGARGQWRIGGDLNYDVFVSRALSKPEYFPTKKWVTGFQVNYSF